MINAIQARGCIPIKVLKTNLKMSLSLLAPKLLLEFLWPMITLQPTKPLKSFKQALDWSESTSNDLQLVTDWLLSANRMQLCGRVPILMIYQRQQEFPQESVIKKTNQIAFSHCCMVVIRFHFLLQSSEFYWPFGLIIDLRWLLMSDAIFILRWSCFLKYLVLCTLK